jgi:hypothetical protein
MGSEYCQKVSLSNLSQIKRKYLGGVVLMFHCSRLIFKCKSNLPLNLFGIHQLMQAPNLDR